MFNIKAMFYKENDVKLGLISLPSKSLEEKREVIELCSNNVMWYCRFASEFT